MLYYKFPIFFYCLNLGYFDIFIQKILKFLYLTQEWQIASCKYYTYSKIHCKVNGYIDIGPSSGKYIWILIRTGSSLKTVNNCQFPINTMTSKTSKKGTQTTNDYEIMLINRMTEYNRILLNYLLIVAPSPIPMEVERVQFSSTFSSSPNILKLLKLLWQSRRCVT